MRHATFWFIFGTVLLDMLALGIIAPVFPKLVIQLEGGNEASAAGMVGLFGTVWAAMQFVFAPVLGALSDRVGRRPVILLSCLGLGLDYAVMALAPTVGWLFLGRMLSGITASSFSTSFAYIADVTEPDQRAAKFGLLGVAFGVGFILGPAVGGLLGEIGLRAPFWAAGALSVVGAAYGWFVLPESLPVERRAPFAWRRANPVGSLGLLRARQALLGLALVAFLYRVAHDALPSLFVLYGDYRFGWTARAVGFALAGVGVVSMIVQGGLVGAAVKRLGEPRALVAGLGFGAVAFTLYGLAPTGALFLLGIPIGGLFGLAYPALQGLMTRRVGADEQGRLQGAIASVMGIAGVIAPVLFTQVFAAAIGPFRATGVPGAPFLLAALLLVTAMVVVRRGVVVSVVALVACLGVPGASAQSVAPPRLTWRPRAPLEGSAVVLELSSPSGDSVTAVRGELAGEPLHFERTPHGLRALAAVPFDRADSVAARATVERAGGATDTVVAWLVPRRRRAPREKLRAAPEFVQPPDSLEQRIKEEQELVSGVRHRAHDTPRLWVEPFVRPRPSAVTDRFGVARVFNGELRSRHMGVDFAGRRGASVRAANRGVVALVADLYLSGTTILIDHGAGLVTGYLHLNRTLVQVGDTVARGQPIGEVGASGRVTGPHLHWLAAYGGITFDPLSLVGLNFDRK
ncbi:MAG TPA: MFS transporter [Gemmatimonadales bacterium]